MPTFRIIPRVRPSGATYSVQRWTWWCGWKKEFTEWFCGTLMEWRAFKTTRAATDHVIERFGTVAEVVEWHP